MNTAKPWYRSRTVWVNLLTFAAGLASLPVGGRLAGAVAVVSGLANLALRALTSQPIAGTTATAAESATRLKLP